MASKEPELKRLSTLESEIVEKDEHITQITDNIQKFKYENEEIKN